MGKTRVFSFRLTSDQIEKLKILSDRYDLTPQDFVRRVVLHLTGDIIEDIKGFQKDISKMLTDRSEEFDIFQQLVADTTSRISNVVEGQSQLFKNEKRKKNKKKPANA